MTIGQLHDDDIWLQLPEFISILLCYLNLSIPWGLNNNSLPTDFLGDTFPSPAGVIKKVSNGEAPPRSPTHYPFVYLFTQER